MPLPQHHYQKNVLAELRTSDDQFMAIHVASPLAVKRNAIEVVVLVPNVRRRA
jgi:hypothetical protein